MTRVSAAITAAIAAIAFVLFPVLGHADDDASALLAKHRAFVGWQLGDGTFNTLRIAGTAANEKGEQILSLDFRSAGLAFNDAYTSTQRAGITKREGFTGSIFWQSDPNGFTTPSYGDAQKYLAARYLLLNEGTTGLSAVSRGTDLVDGKQVSVVRVSAQNADPIDLYVDPATGAYVEAVVDPEGLYHTTIYLLGYKEIAPGKKLLSSYRYLNDRNLTYSYGRVETNVPVSDGELHPPIATATWSYGNLAPTPIRATSYNRIVVDATVNGVKGTFVLATGLDGIYLDDHFADRANVTVLAGQKEFHDLAHKWATRVRKMATFQLGDATLSNAIVYSADFRKDYYQGIDWQGYDGFIGYDLFAASVVRLNLSNSTIDVQDPSTDPAVSNGVQLYVDLMERAPIVPVTMNHWLPVKAMLDTGTPGLAVFGPDLFLQRQTKKPCTDMENLTIGPIVYNAMAYCREIGTHQDYLRVGYDFIKHFDFVFDYPHGRLFLTPNKN